MMICRCAWHPQYYGYPSFRGIASWRGWNLRFTDGICPRCVERFRKEHHLLLVRREDRDVSEVGAEEVAAGRS